MRHELHLETLEPRRLLTGAPATGWPTAPFHRKEYRDGTWVYVNQFGSAKLVGQHVDAQHPFATYDLLFDDGGTITTKVTSPSAPVDLAYYPADGGPRNVDVSGNAAGASVTGRVSSQKINQYLAVRPHGPGASATFDVLISGVAAARFEPLAIDARTNAGSDGTTISGADDYDFWRFRTTRAGTWVVRVIPDRQPNVDAGGPMDATLMVFNAKGSPIGGTFTQPIDTGGVLKPEQWTGTGLAAGQWIYARVDGAGGSTGGYGIAAYWVDSSTVSASASVSVAATTATTTSGGATPGRFTIGSSVTVGRRALPVKYTLGGTAVNGQDYQALSGVAWIPSGQRTVTVDVLATAGLGADKTVLLQLSSDPSYALAGGASSALVTILKQPA